MSKEFKYENKKGCFKRSLPMLSVLCIVLVIGIIVFLNQILLNMKGLEKYETLITELDAEVTESDFTKSPITTQDKQNFAENVMLSAKSKDEQSLFDENNNFVFSVWTPENVEITESSLVLDKVGLACFISSALDAGWLDTMLDVNENLFQILEISNLKTENGLTTITAVGKIKFTSLFSSEELSELKSLGTLPNDVFVTYTASFNFNEERNISSSMQINKLSNESNTLLLDILFSDDNNKTQENLDSIMSFVLDQFEQVLTSFNLVATFEGENLTISKTASSV